MYQHAALPTALATTLPFTGLSVIWILLAAVAMFAAGLALSRLIPKRER